MEEKEKLCKPEIDLAHQVENVRKKVLVIERQKLHMQKPRGIIDEIKRIIETEVDAS